MANITIRNLDDDVTERLRSRTTHNGRSIEEEAHQIRSFAVDVSEEPLQGLGTAIHNLFAPFGGSELDLPPRDAMRKIPKFG
ncbi:MAG: plasmid stabilization protein [Gammaproteobacteria bacterium]|nr:plasmid stabilization protein [Gammaproteobacteria bacterium]